MSALTGEILLATRNAHKIQEISDILKDEPVGLKTLLDFELTEDAVEDGETYEENAIKKALFYARNTGIPSLADDSGLEIEYLEGKPGIHSARFINPRASFTERNIQILEWMKEVPEEGRKARFVCVVAFATPEKILRTFRGELHGLIATSMKGQFGFGYDPIFWVPEHKHHLAELDPEIKNRISHRARALQAAQQYIAQLSRS
jgi:XTP/dITP diphosphohydrolase